MILLEPNLALNRQYGLTKIDRLRILPRPILRHATHGMKNTIIVQDEQYDNMRGLKNLYVLANLMFLN